MTSASLSADKVSVQSDTSTGPNRPLARLRAFTVALVVALHATIAYHPWAPPPPQSLLTQPRWWQAFPVVDTERWQGWAVFIGFNDLFFMALMFFVSGLFVWTSLERKGPGRFVVDRLIRLGIPFLLATAIVAPAAYAATYLQATAMPTWAGFWKMWFGLGAWPAGPAWFIWVLLVFDVIAVLVFSLGRGAVASIRHHADVCFRRPWIGVTALIMLSSTAYASLVIPYGPLYWTVWGPFAFQTSRLLHYAVYFAAGVVLGSQPIERSFLSPTTLGRRWVVWSIAALVGFVLVSAVQLKMAGTPTTSPLLGAFAIVTFAVSCAFSSFALIALFLRFGTSAPGRLYGFCAASYGVYLLHYPIVAWIQYTLVPWHVGGLAKGVLATLVALYVTYLLVVFLRRARPIARVI